MPLTDIDLHTDYDDESPAAPDKVTAAKVDIDHRTIEAWLNTILRPSWNKVIRPDDTLVDQLVRSRNLHPEVAALIASKAGWQPKADVQVASTANINLAAPGAIIDTRTMVANDRFLAKNQTVPSQNGIYVWNGAATPATRATDADTSTELGYAFVTVAVGSLSTQAGTSWVCNQSTTDIVTLGTTSITFGQAGGQLPSAAMQPVVTALTTTLARLAMGITDPSAAMAPVIQAATLALARKGLGVTNGIDACAEYGAAPGNAAGANITAINAAIAAAIADGSKCVFFSIPGQYDAGALTNVDQVVLHGNGAYFNPSLASYKINQIGSVAGKKGTKYAIYGGVPRHTGYSVSLMTRSGSTVTVTIPSNANLRVGAFVTIQGAVETQYNGTWPVATLIGGTQFTFSIGGATPTTPATGTITGYWWELLDDANHTPTGFAYCTTPDVNTLRVYYTDQAKKISHLIVAPDDALAPHGVVVGGDVGTTYANLMAFCPLACSLNGGGGGAGIPALVKVPPLLTSALSVSNGGTAIRRLNHPAVDSNDVPIVTVKSPAGGQSLPKLVQLQWGTTYVDIIAVGPLAGFVSWGGAAFGQSLSDNVNVPTFTWTAGTGILRVDHGNTFSDNMLPMIIPHGGTYHVQTYNITSTYFEVQFFTFAGALVTGAANANMKFSYMKTRSLVPVSWPDDMEVTVRRGLVPIRVDDYFRVAGNNFWLSALMEAI